MEESKKDKDRKSLEEFKKKYKSGPNFNYYKPQDGDWYVLKNKDSFHEQALHLRERILLLLHLANRNGLGGRTLAIYYMDSVKPPYLPHHGDFGSYERERNIFRIDLVHLCETYLERIQPQPNEEEEE
jgi:hypothetical protein